MAKRGSYIDILGQRFGKLIAIRIDHLQGNRAIWMCKCDCGKETLASVSNLRNGHTRSCGCLVREEASKAHFVHGHKGKTDVDRLYPVWRNMKQRCFLQSHKYYSHYGGRGITVCEDWLKYEKFMKWAYDNGYDPNAPRGKCTIDRINVNGNYEPSNCRWVGMDVQARNKRSSKKQTNERNDDLSASPF